MPAGSSSRASCRHFLQHQEVTGFPGSEASYRTRRDRIMSRAGRLKLAQETVEIVERGSYVAVDGRPVEIAADVQRCLEATRYFPPEAMPGIRDRVLAEE